MENANEIKIELIKNEMEILNHATSGFKITRIINGQTVDVELTDQELNNAFYYQENIYRISDIGIVLEKMEEDNSLEDYTAEEICKNDALMEKIVSEYNDNIDNHNMEWNEAARDAIQKNIKYERFIDTDKNKDTKSDEKCCACGNNRFTASQVCYHDIIVDSDNNFIKEIGIGQSEKPYGAYRCIKCDVEYEELEDIENGK